MVIREDSTVVRRRWRTCFVLLVQAPIRSRSLCWYACVSVGFSRKVEGYTEEIFWQWLGVIPWIATKMRQIHTRGMKNSLHVRPIWVTSESDICLSFWTSRIRLPCVVWWNSDDMVDIFCKISQASFLKPWVSSTVAYEPCTVFSN